MPMKESQVLSHINVPALRSSTPTGMPGRSPAGEARLAATLDESDVLKERYRRAPAKKNRPMIRAERFDL